MRVILGFVMLVGLMAGTASWLDETGAQSRSVEKVLMYDGPHGPPTPPPMR